MKTDDEIRVWAADRGLEFVIPNGYPEAFVGATTDGEEARAVYDQEKIIAIFMKRDGMNREDALDFFSFNIEGSHFKGGPLYIDTP